MPRVCCCAEGCSAVPRVCCCAEGVLLCRGMFCCAEGARVILCFDEAELNLIVGS